MESTSKSERLKMYGRDLSKRRLSGKVQSKCISGGEPHVAKCSQSAFQAGLPRDMEISLSYSR